MGPGTTSSSRGHDVVIPNGVRDLHCVLFFSERDTPIVNMIGIFDENRRKEPVAAASRRRG